MVRFDQPDGVFDYFASLFLSVLHQILVRNFVLTKAANGFGGHSLMCLLVYAVTGSGKLFRGRRARD
jgi:hypothetical protein